MLKFQAGTHHAVVCAGCGLLCDDVALAQDDTGNLTPLTGGCNKSTAFFGHAPRDLICRIHGKPATLDEAVAEAVHLLSQARHPLIGGLATDVEGMRAALHLAECCGATLDHMNASGYIRNLAVLQNSGWQTCTFTEVRNRVDVLVLIGTNAVEVMPRFFERLIWNTSSMFGMNTRARQIVYLGGRDLDTHAGVSPDGHLPQVLPCDLSALPEVIATLRALVMNRPVQASQVAGIAVADLRQLAQRLREAQYSVVGWAAGALKFPHAELTIQNITEMVKTLNATTRASGLPLGGSDGEMNATQVSAWISGYPARLSYRRGFPEYDPDHFATEALLQNEEVDALLWLSALDPMRLPPPSAVPTIVLGHAAMQCEQVPHVFISIGTPGVDHAGVAFRSDNVVSLPLKALRSSALPTAQQVLGAMTQALSPSMQKAE